MKHFIPFLFVCFLLACGAAASPERKFDKHDVAFTCPTGWKITEEDSMDGEGYYLSCEMDGLTSSALLTMSWVNDTIDLDAMLELYKEELKNNEIFKRTNITFEAIEDGTYNGKPARVANYRLTLLSDETEGSLYCFYGSMKTFALVKQQSTEDDAKNKKGFELIESSFTIK